ncbi:MAG TPA: hypothetical protein VM492_04495 [Sumerlaeia bacterium]|nr:hypothetical protein [Sumerlaeia bacterium]
MLAMYVHTHWGYRRPYCARAWTLTDWENYLEGLVSLGFDSILFWPLLDCMPPRPNHSDRAFLEKAARVIDLAHDRFGLRFVVVVCPNTIGNERADAFDYETRPYFACERKLNPASADDARLLLEGRRNQLAPLAAADGVAIIDSDPGGWVGSSNEEFVGLMRDQTAVFREFNPRATVDYWMLFGWENYNRFWERAAAWQEGDPPPALLRPGGTAGAQVFAETLALMREHIAEPWGVFASWPEHVEATDALGLGSKRAFFPYGTIEGEPSFPLTNFTPDPIHRTIGGEIVRTAYPRGLLGNAQSHCLQLPNTYCFSHFAQGGDPDALDLEGFAEDVLPGAGGVVARAWEAIGGGDAETRLSCAAALDNEIGRPRAKGRSSGLLFGDADRFLRDLAANLRIQAALSEFAGAVDSRKNAVPALRALMAHLHPYRERVGFVDAYGGPLAEAFNGRLAQLADPEIDRVLRDFHDWRDPAVRNGILPRLFQSVLNYCRKGGESQ